MWPVMKDSRNSSYQRKIRWWPDGSLSMMAGERGRAEGINLIRFCSVTNKGEMTTVSSNKKNFDWKWSANFNDCANWTLEQLYKGCSRFPIIVNFKFNIKFIFLKKNKKSQEKSILGYAFGIKMSSVICVLCYACHGRQSLGPFLPLKIYESFSPYWLQGIKLSQEKQNQNVK